jgi:hypothetical protein
MIPCALYCNAQSRKVKSELEAHFNSPLTADAALQKFISGRKVDGDFWKRVNVLYEKTWCDRAGDYPLAEFKPEVLAAWKKKFSSSTDYAELDRMFSAPIPCPPLEHAWECGSLIGAVTSKFSSLRRVARLQMWRIRFALETRDKAAVLQALKRINYIDEYLENDPFLIGQIVKIHINREKIEILSQVLAAKILDGSDLRELKAASRRTRAKLPELERIAVFGEALFGIDYYYAILQSTKDYDGTPVIPVSTFRFLVPQLWFTAEANYLAYLKSFRNANRFHDIQALGDDFVLRFGGQGEVKVHSETEHLAVKTRHRGGENANGHKLRLALGLPYLNFREYLGKALTNSTPDFCLLHAVGAGKKGLFGYETVGIGFGKYSFVIGG